MALFYFVYQRCFIIIIHIDAIVYYFTLLLQFCFHFLHWCRSIIAWLTFTTCCIIPLFFYNFLLFCIIFVYLVFSVTFFSRAFFVQRFYLFSRVYFCALVYVVNFSVAYTFWFWFCLVLMFIFCGRGFHNLLVHQLPAQPVVLFS